MFKRILSLQSGTSCLQDIMYFYVWNMYFTLFAVVTNGALHLGKTADCSPAAFRVHVHTFSLRNRVRTQKAFRLELQRRPVGPLVRPTAELQEYPRQPHLMLHDECYNHVLKTEKQSRPVYSHLAWKDRSREEIRLAERSVPYLGWLFRCER